MNVLPNPVSASSSATSETVTAATSELASTSRLRPIVVVVLFVAVFLATRIVIKPINDFDYQVHYRALNLLWNGHSPYEEPDFLYPPWAILITAPLVGQPLETWLAISVAIFVVAVLDTGKPWGLLLMLHPIFILLIASSNPEWIFTGAGLWLLFRYPKGWGRGVAWLLLASKPQTSFLLLIFDGLMALRQRDWKAFLLSAGVAAISIVAFPPPFGRYWLYEDSMSILWRFGVPGAIAATAFILTVRWQRRYDYKTLGILLSQVWTPYAIQYHLMGVLFTMRGASLLRTVFYLAAGFGIMLAFWRDYHVAEYIGCALLILLSGVMAPTYPLADRLRPKVSGSVVQRLPEST